MGDFLVHIGSSVDDNVLSQVVMLQVVVVVVCVCREVIFSAILSRLHSPYFFLPLEFFQLFNCQLTLAGEQLHTFTGP